MKSIILTTLAALTLLTTPQARAWTYNDGDVLLVFRRGSQDVEFDLGKCHQFPRQDKWLHDHRHRLGFSLVTGTFGSLPA